MTMTLDRRTVLGAGLAALAAPAFGAGGPAPAVITRFSPAFDRMVAPDAMIGTIASGIRWAEGPVWVEQGGYLLFSDVPGNVIHKWKMGVGLAPFLSPSGLPNPDPKLIREAGSNGLAIGHDGALLIANSGGRSIDRVDLATKRRTVLVDRYQGKKFNSCNDMHVARSGAIYFTDPPYGLEGGNESAIKELPHNGVYRWTKGGEAVLLDGTLSFPNGIALSPDERRMYVAVSDDTPPRIMVYDLDAKGLPIASRVLVDAAPWQAAGGKGLPDGMKVARDGTLVCSAPGGIWFLTPEGEPIGRIGNDRPMANCAFGERGRALFITADTQVLRVPLKAGWMG